VYEFDQALPIAACVFFINVSRIRGYHSVAADAARVLQAPSIAHARGSSLFGGLMTCMAHACSDFLYFGQEIPKAFGILFDAVICFTVSV
jgi:hypothetical protein